MRARERDRQVSHAMILYSKESLHFSSAFPAKTKSVYHEHSENYFFIINAYFGTTLSKLYMLQGQNIIHNITDTPFIERSLDMFKKLAWHHFIYKEAR